MASQWVGPITPQPTTPKPVEGFLALSLAIGGLDSSQHGFKGGHGFVEKLRATKATISPASAQMRLKRDIANIAFLVKGRKHLLHLALTFPGYYYAAILKKSIFDMNVSNMLFQQGI